MGRLLWFSAIFAALLMSVGVATADDAYPSRPVHIMVPYPAGGGVDIVARTLGDELSKHWGQPIVIENRPGASWCLLGGLPMRFQRAPRSSWRDRRLYAILPAGCFKPGDPNA